MTADTRRFALAQDVVLQDTGDEAILMNLHDETLFALNGTGAAIVRRLAQGAPLGALVDALVLEYHAPADAVAADVRGLVGQLEARGLLVPQEAA